MKIQDVLTTEEIRELVTPSDVRGLSEVIATWLIIAATFVAVAMFPHPATVVAAVIILGGRHLALAILMHEAAHRSLFKTKRLNEIIGHALCAAPSWNHLQGYRKHHIQHHTNAGTDQDVDVGLKRPFPVSKASMARKVARDLLGIAGLKRAGFLFLMDCGFYEYTASDRAKKIDQTGRTAMDVVRCGAKNLFSPIAANAVLFTILALCGHPELFLLWVISWLTTYSLFLRIRSIAEHACTEDTIDPFRNTRTTYASLLARLTVAPHHVNYHLEHHLLMTVPCHKLRRLHRILQDRDALNDSPIAKNYAEVLRTATARP